MLKTRLWMGAILIALATGMLRIDQQLAPWYPFLFILVLGLSQLACHEILRLIGNARALPGWFCHLGVALVIVSNWPAHVLHLTNSNGPWPWIVGAFTAVAILVFLVEMAQFNEPGASIVRMAVSLWIVAYLGLLPSFLVQLRWLPDPEAIQRGSLALALAIFVPKMGDTGAYFTGRILGRHKMTPVLSPKKTWEGAVGGLTSSVLTTVGINRLGPVLAGGWLAEVGFGITVGIAGMLGDLAESLIKRDCLEKDASQIMPGFGGVLDVIDALLFAAPMAYLWLCW